MTRGSEQYTPSAAVHRARRAREVRRTQYAVSVREAVGTIEHGCEIYGLSRGQYSLIDLLEYILEATGPADLVVSTWTAAGADIDYALRLTRDGRVRSIVWLVDFSFPSRQPGYCRAMRDRFGDDAIRVTKNHAKFVLVGNDAWKIVLRTSMNLNENRRLESYEISDDAELFEYLAAVVAQIFAAGDGHEQLEVAAGTNERRFHDDTDAHSPPVVRRRFK